MIPKEFDPKVKWQYSDNYGRLVGVGLEIIGFHITIINCYFPT